MTPYESFHFFLYLLIPLVPSALFGLLGLSGRIRLSWVFLTTIGMLFLMVRPADALIQAIGFIVLAWLVTWGYLKYRRAPESRNSAQVFYLALILAILPLALVKLNPYLKTAALWQTPIGFLGISYLTFRVAGTIMEIRDGLIKEVHFLDFIAFVLFFPTLSSGPIDRCRRFSADLVKPLSGREYAALAIDGVDHLFRGFLYKFIIAYLVNKYWLEPLGHVYGFWATVKYMYAYSLYLFFDFAGYSAFAVGVSYLLGIRTPENFNRPFLAKNIKDFWNRWHITLSAWFRDYIYMRFVLDSTKKKRFKSRYTTSYIGYLLLFGIMGIWHGTQLRYIMYGLYHAGLMTGFDGLERKNKDLKFWGQGPVWDTLALLVTVHFVTFGFLIFSGRLG